VAAKVSEAHLITPNASNWVFRGEPPEPTMCRVLSSYFHVDPKAAVPQLSEYAGVIRGMAEADATEVNIAGYLRSLEDRYLQDHPARHRRAVAIALWHIAKCGEVRDRALRLLEKSPNAAT
jgi:hypothetical protein